MLARQYGCDAKLTDLLPALVVDCPKSGSVSVLTGARQRSRGGDDRTSTTFWLSIVLI
jgi:hypothetical protein